MTSSDLQKRLGVSSAATANSWADELTTLSRIPVQRNTRGIRIFTPQQMELIVQAFELQKSGAAPTRAEALRRVLEPIGLLLAKTEASPDLNSSSQTFSLIPESVIKSIDIPASPREVHPPLHPILNFEPSIEDSFGLSPVLTPISRFTAVWLSISEWTEELVGAFSYLFKQWKRDGNKLLRAIRFALSVRDNPIWTAMPLERRRSWVRSFRSVNHFLLTGWGFIGLLLLSSYLVFLLLNWLKLPPVFLINWKQVLSVFLISSVVPIVMFFYLPNDV